MSVRSTVSSTPSIDSHVADAVDKLQQHDNPKQATIILRDLKEIVGEKKLSDHRKKQIRTALCDGLGSNYVHTPAFTAIDADEGGDLVRSPIDMLADAMADLGMDPVRFQIDEIEQNVLAFFDINQRAELTHVGRNDKESTLLPGQLTFDWIKQTQSELKPTEDIDDDNEIDGLYIEITMTHTDWLLRRYLSDYVCGVDPEEILYVLGTDGGYIQAGLLITRDSEITEADGLIVLKQCEVRVKLGFLTDEQPVSAEMNKRSWNNQFDEVVVSVTFDPTTNTFSNCVVDE